MTSVTGTPATARSTRPTADPAGDGATLRPIPLVAGREMVATVQKRSFWVGFGTTLAIVVAAAVLPGILAGDDVTTWEVGLVGESVELAPALDAWAAGIDDTTVEITEFADEAEAGDAIADGSVPAAVAGDRVLVEDNINPQLLAILDQAARTATVEQGLAAGDISTGLADELVVPQILVVESLDPADDDEMARQILTSAGVFIIFVQIFGFGYAVAGGIVEEKSSRVVEVLLGKLRPHQLLAGKLIGVWLLTTAQMIVITVVGLSGASLAGSLELPPGWEGVVLLVFGWYAIAYIFYAGIFAICGALAASAEELQSTMTPATLLVMGAYVAGFVALNDPDGLIAVVTSLFPATSPLVMPLRMTFSDVAPLEVVASIALALAASVLAVLLAGRIYRGSALKSRQSGLREAWRAARA
ncbi:MAG: ABC transporter permease [Acidimicrobiia bacterium]|nr:ABC transporter permease [Acidimicrobiia bacterium]